PPSATTPASPTTKLSNARRGRMWEPCPQLQKRIPPESRLRKSVSQVRMSWSALTFTKPTAFTLTALHLNANNSSNYKVSDRLQSNAEHEQNVSEGIYK